MIRDSSSDKNGSNGATKKIIETAVASLMLELQSWPKEIGIPAIDYINRVIKSDGILSSLKTEDVGVKKIKLNGSFDIHKIWRYTPKKYRTNLGQFFTPIKVVNHILDVCQKNDPNFINGNGPIADITCGSAIFLEEFIRRQLTPSEEREIDPILALNRTIGVDKDPQACALGKLSVAFRVCDTLFRQNLYEYFDGSHDWPLPQIQCFNSLDYKTDVDSFTIEHFFDKYEDGFDAIIGNFPFLESKRMNKYDPDLKDWLKARFPKLFGAFDLYVPFVYQSLKLLKKEGIFGVVLPNKVLVGKYARYLREEILKENQLIQISDFSHVKNSFTQTGVYPIALFFKSGETQSRQITVAVSVRTLDELPKVKPHLIDPYLFDLISPNYTFFCQNPRVFKYIDRLYKSEDSIRLKEILDIRTTISFHKKGVREKFIKPTEKLSKKPQGDVYPYLGGESYTKKNEVDSYNIDWKGYSIYYSKNMKEKIGHNVAPLDIFLRPKIIFCQHSQRLRGYFDSKGKFLTKDVYPIAFVKEGKDPTDLGWLMTAYFNSTFVSSIYNTIFHGITIGSAYYHYLPTFLNEIAIVLPEKIKQKEIVDYAKRIQLLCEKNGEIDEIISLYEKLDLEISLVNGLTEEEHKMIIQKFNSVKIFQT